MISYRSLFACECPTICVQTQQASYSHGNAEGCMLKSKVNKKATINQYRLCRKHLFSSSLWLALNTELHFGLFKELTLGTMQCCYAVLPSTTFLWNLKLDALNHTFLQPNWLLISHIHALTACRYSGGE